MRLIRFDYVSTWQRAAFISTLRLFFYEIIQQRQCIRDSVVNLLSTTIYYETSLVSQLANALRAFY